MRESQSHTDDIVDAIAEIYDAVGDADRWQRLEERAASISRLSPEIDQHLETARRLHDETRRLISNIETLASLHDQLALGALVVDRDGFLLCTNAGAAQLLSAFDGLMLDGNRVRAASAHDDAQLQRAIERAATGVCREDDLDMIFIRVARPGKGPVLLLALPTVGPGLRFFEDGLPVTLLVIDPDVAMVPAADTLRVLYGFTAREAEIAALLIQGLSIKDAAASLGVSMTTARTFVSQIIAKTDSHSQAELMLRLLAIPRTHSTT